MPQKNQKLGPDWRLHVIVGGEEKPFDTAEAALRGGARVLQYRGKKKPGELQFREASALRAMTRDYGAYLVVNDRADVALLVDADGLHLGGEDLPVIEARRILGKEKIIGATAHTLKEAEAAEQQSADYLGYGAVFATRSKKSASVSGLDGLERIVRRAAVPIIGIGGISRRNITEVLETGASGVAVLSAVLEAEDSLKATQELMNKIKARAGNA